MTEPHSDAELDQTSRSRRSRGSGINPEQLGRTPHRHHVTDRLGRGDEQQQSRCLRKRHQPALEGLLDAPRQRPRARQPESAGQLRGSEVARQFHQRQGVPVCLSDDAVDDPLVERTPDHRAEQRPRFAVIQAANDQLRQAREVLLAA